MSPKNAFQNIETTEIETIEIENFDKDGEPEIRLFSDGSAEIVFNFMPPLNGSEDRSNLDIFETFDIELSKIINKEVIWEDCEIFTLSTITRDDINKIKIFLESF